MLKIKKTMKFLLSVSNRALKTMEKKINSSLEVFLENVLMKHLIGAIPFTGKIFKKILI